MIAVHGGLPIRVSGVGWNEIGTDCLVIPLHYVKEGRDVVCVGGDKQHGVQSTQTSNEAMQQAVDPTIDGIRNRCMFSDFKE